METLNFERVIGYLKSLILASSWAAVDAIVCKADTDPEGVATYTLPRAVNLASAFREIPESCAMRDGRKWKSIPFVLISDLEYHFTYPAEISRLKITLIRPTPYTGDVIRKISDTVDDYIQNVLDDYHDLGLMIAGMPIVALPACAGRRSRSLMLAGRPHSPRLGPLVRECQRCFLTSRILRTYHCAI